MYQAAAVLSLLHPRDQRGLPFVKNAMRFPERGVLIAVEKCCSKLLEQTER